MPLAECLQDAQKRPEGPQKVIVFSFFVQTLHRLADMLAYSNQGFVMLRGDMNIDERTKVGA